MLWVLVVLALVAPVLALPTSAAERVKVGVLKLTSSAPIFIGVEPELVYFQAAAPIATALAVGQVEVGATGLTAALYNIVLGGEKLWIGVTQLGSTFHYQMGNILERHGLQLSDVRIVPLQAMGAALEALKGKHGDAVMLPQPFPGTAEAQGFGRIISSRYYDDAVARSTAGRPAPGPRYDEVVAITAKYTGAPPAVITLGFPYQDRNGRPLAGDVDTQMQWWVKHGFLKSSIPLTDIVDTSFVEVAAAVVKE